MINISDTINCLWAKKNRNGGSDWLPLITHLNDCAALAPYVWKSWVSEGVKNELSKRCRCSQEKVKRLLLFICATHDIGKATPVFQAKTSAFLANDLDEMLIEKILEAGYIIKPHRAFSHPERSPHAMASQLILEGAGCSRNVAVIVGAHHGKPPSSDELCKGRIDGCEENYFVSSCGKTSWEAAWKEIAGLALEISGFGSFDEMPVPDMPSQVLLSGLLVMIDWLASNEGYFPYVDINAPLQICSSEERAKKAFASLAFLKTRWRIDEDCFNTDIFRRRFGLIPRRMQSEALRVAAEIENPGLVILEAPMGSGKTEIAFAAAEMFAYKTGRSGVYFALPTQATSDGIFPRMLQWINELGDGTHSIELMHSKAQFNDSFQALRHVDDSNGIWESEGTDEAAAVFGWFKGAKKSILADFAVGTIDQLLMAALKQKHLMLRHLGLAGKVVIIDECHAYDAYMDQYLTMTLRWLGAYNVPVIMLSATLPAEKRRIMAEAYLNKTASKVLDWDAPEDEAYPLLTYSEGKKLYSVKLETDSFVKAVEIAAINDEEIANTLEVLLTEGGCAGIIVNSVRRAQSLAELLRVRFGDATVRLLHSRFLAPERIIKENELRMELGRPTAETKRPFLRIVVGTQVIEQSLDLDFDILITDLCPMDLLLQRIGRLHRHDRQRSPKLSKPRCFVLGMNEPEGFESAASFIYGDYILMRTKAVLPKLIMVPDDICHLVQMVYNNEENISYSILQDYNKAKEDWENRIAIKKRKAESFRIHKPWNDLEATIEDWLNTIVPVTDAAGEAAVRDGQDALEVIALKRSRDGGFISFDESISLSKRTPDDDIARRIARNCLRLPSTFSYGGENVIRELEERNSQEIPLWRKSPWLQDSLILVFDSANKAYLCDYKLKYDAFYGLTYLKEDGEDE